MKYYVSLRKRMRRIKSALRRRKRLVLVGCLLLGAGVVVAALRINPTITRYVEGPGFRDEIGWQTSKGLHFSGAYESIHRTGTFTASSPHFEAHEGYKAMRSMKARDIKAVFNPAGVFARRWQLDEVRIASGEVVLQTYEPTPQPKPDRKWYAFVMPDRVYLSKVICDQTDVKWDLRGEESGIYGTRLLVIPHDRDFEYRASGGVMKMPVMPDLAVEGVHVLVTKKEISLYKLALADGLTRIEASGTAGLSDGRQVDLTTKFEGISIPEWVGKKYAQNLAGRVTGEVRWTGPDLKLESSSGKGRLRLAGGRLHNLDSLDKLASFLEDDALRDLKFDRCSAEFEWEYPVAHVREIDLAVDGVFQTKGNASVTKSTLSGTLQLGVAPRYLRWLPRAREEIFTREEGGYLWTTVKLSGTLAKPQSDLMPRIRESIEKSPSTMLGLFFKQVGSWLEETFQ